MIDHKQLLKWREKEGLTQEQVADRIGMHLNSYRKIETGQRKRILPPYEEALRAVMEGRLASRSAPVEDEITRTRRMLARDLEHLASLVGDIAGCPTKDALDRFRFVTNQYMEAVGEWLGRNTAKVKKS